MKLYLFKIWPIWATFTILHVSGMYREGLNLIKSAENDEKPIYLDEILDFQQEQISSFNKPRNPIRKMINNLAEVVEVTKDRLGIFRNLGIDEEVKLFVENANHILGQSTRYKTRFGIPPSSSTYNSWKETLEQGKSLLEKDLSWNDDRFIILKSFIRLLKVFPIELKEGQELISEWSDQVILQLRAAKEYKKAIKRHLEPLKVPTNVKEEDILEHQALEECIDRAMLIGKKQKSTQSNQDFTEIDHLIHNHLMKARLPKDKESVESLVSELRLNFRYVSPEGWEDKFLIKLYKHLSENPSMIQERLSELEHDKGFLRDILVPFSKSDLRYIVSEKLDISPSVKDNIEAIMKFQWAPEPEKINHIMDEMKTLVEEGLFDSARNSYKVLIADVLYYSHVDHQVHVRLFEGEHLPSHMKDLWLKIYPNLSVKKESIFDTEAMLIKENLPYFHDAKRQWLRSKIKSSESKPLEDLSQILERLKVSPKQDIDQEQLEAIFKIVLATIEPIKMGDDLNPRKIPSLQLQRYSMVLETILRVLEYQPQSITPFLKYMQQEVVFRQTLYTHAKSLIQTAHLSENPVPQLKEFANKIIEICETIWSDTLHQGDTSTGNVKKMNKEKDLKRLETARVSLAKVIFDGIYL
ncbi:hypothetical protein DFH28DRAFT_503997 [Melampsora americana]|nr:hypothetical protein DFH28DRAFT_503997 [Melampsora americana]